MPSRSASIQGDKFLLGEHTGGARRPDISLYNGESIVDQLEGSGRERTQQRNKLPITICERFRILLDKKYEDLLLLPAGSSGASILSIVIYFMFVK